MEASEEVAAHIVKGKRTKRLRVDQSSIPFGLTADSSSGDGGTNWSPATSIDEFQDSTEEEDMANCLILLAKGHSRDFPEQQQQHHQDHDSRVLKSKVDSRTAQVNRSTTWKKKLNRSTA